MHTPPRTTAALILAIAGMASACESSVSPNPYEAWTADIQHTNQVLFMGFTRRGAALRGSANLADLLGVGSGEALTLTGTRRTDTLDIVFAPLGGTYRFTGWYVQRGAGITGTLDGGAFVQTPIGFR